MNSLIILANFRYLAIRLQGRGPSMSDISVLKTVNTICVSCLEEKYIKPAYSAHR